MLCKKVTMWFILLLMSLSAVVSAAEATLVRLGKPEAVILLDKKPTKSAQMGAFELQYHVKLITGVELPIVTEAPAGKLVIKIGGENEDIKEEATRIRFSENKILLTGGDTADYGKVDYQKPGTFPSVNYHWKGSLFAVYDFLEDYCDVHFYGLAPNDTTYKKRTTLRVTVKNRDFVPGMDGFRDFYDDYFRSHTIKLTQRDQFLWKLRWRSSVTYAKVNHNTYSIYFSHWGKAKHPTLSKAFKSKRPELFARGYEGKGASCGAFLESKYPGDLDLPPQLCYTNPGTIDYYAREGLTYFHGKNVLGGWMNIAGSSSPDKNLMPRFPGKPYFYPYEGNDSGMFCKCAECQKLVDGNSFSNTKFQFMNALVRRAREIDPKANLGFATLAYGETLEFPADIKIEDNVSVELCLTNYAWWHPVIYKKSMENYEKWVKAMKGKAPLTLWLYIYGPQHDASVHYGAYKPFPLFYPWQMAKQMQRFNRDGIKGVFAECKMPANYLEAYIVSKLAYDPSIDPNKLIAKFFRDYYGDAGTPMLQFYRIIENAAWSGAIIPNDWKKDPNVAYGPGGRIFSPWWSTNLWTREANFNLGSHERIKKLTVLIERAKTLVKTPEEKERLERFIKTAWQPALEGRREHDIYLKQKQIPPRSMLLTPIADGANGDPTKVDWSKAYTTEKWLDINGNDIGSTSTLQVAVDSKFVYFKYHDKQKPLLNEGLWSENIEFFFTDGSISPMYHYAHGPKAGSKPIGQIYQNINDDLRQNEYDFKDRSVSVPTDKDWTLYIAIPKDRLPLKNNIMSCDFFRMRHDGKKWHVSCWQPTYTVSGNKGMDSYGKMYITPFVIENSDFKYLWKNQATFVVKDPEAQDGSAGMQIGKYSWYLSYFFPKGFPKGKLKLIARIRVEAKNADTISFGVHNQTAKKRLIGKSVPAATVLGKKYVDVEIGIGEFGDGMYFFAGAIYFQKKWHKNPDDKTFVDNLRFEKAD